MKKRNLFVVCVAIALALTMVLAVACGKQQNTLTDSRNYVASESTAKPIAAPEAEQKDAQVRAAEAGHTHSYTVWNHDETEHWKSCSSCGAVDMRTYLPHTFDGDTCECGATPHTTHQWTVWRYDAENHWRVCYICGSQQTEGKAAHEYNNGLCECGKLEKGEFKDTPIVDMNGYVAVGKIEGVDNWNLERPFTQDANRADHYSLELDLKGGDEFKVRHPNDTGFANGEWGYNQINIVDGSEITDKAQLFKETGAYGGNIYVKQDCHVILNRYADSAGNTLDIEVKSVSGEIVEPEGGYGVVGTIGGVTDWNNDKLFNKVDEGHYSITLNLKTGDEFKVRTAGSWTKEWGYKEIYMQPGSKVADKTELFKETGDYGGNIYVLKDCTVTLHRYDDSSTLDIYVDEVSDIGGGGGGGTTKEMWLVGTIRGVESWGDNVGNAVKMTYNETASEYTVDVTFQAGDRFQLKPEGKSWDGQKGGESLGTVTYDPSVTNKPSGSVFTGSGDINVQHSCTVTITLKAGKINILIKSITINTQSYTYTFWLYAPSWNNIVIHIWNGTISTGNWAAEHMTKANGGWWYWVYTSPVARSGKINIIMANNGLEGESNRVTLQDTNDDKAGLIDIKTNMYFKAATNAVYSTWEETGAPSAPVMPTAVTPVQVATIPLQTIRKQRLAA